MGLSGQWRERGEIHPGEVQAIGVAPMDLAEEGGVLADSEPDRRRWGVWAAARVGAPRQGRWGGGLGGCAATV